MNAVQVFESSDFGKLEVLMIDGKPLFPATACAQILGYSKPHDAVSRHCRYSVKHGVPHPQKVATRLEMNFIPEGDLYRLIIRSKLPAAERFERWVFDEVLPTLRQSGEYSTKHDMPRSLPEALRLAANLAEANGTLQIENSRLGVENTIMEPKAEYFDELVERGVNSGVRETANQLGIGQTIFVAFLIKHKYLYRDKRGKLTPYAQYVDDLFVVKECFNASSAWSGTQTLVAPKGKETFRLLLVGQAG